MPLGTKAERQLRQFFLPAFRAKRPGAEVESSSFPRAVLQSQQWSFSEILLIGTATSAWATLLYDRKPEEGTDIKLWLDLEDETGRNGSGLSPATSERLCDYLRQKFSVTARILLLSEDPTPNNCHQLMNQLLVSVAGLSADRIVLDITHSFRWMPQVTQMALQCRQAFANEQHLEIIYGKVDGSVQILGEMLERGSDVINAFTLFFNKLESSGMENLLDKIYPDIGSPMAKAASALRDALKDLSRTLQGNLLFNIVISPHDGPYGDVVRRIRNAANNYAVAAAAHPEEAWDWMNIFISRLNQFVDEFAPQNNQLPRHQICLQLAEMFAKRRFFAQALIALDLAFEFFLLAYYHRVDTPPRDIYNTVKNLRRQFFDIIEDQLIEKLWAVSNSRNVVAHGGSSQEALTSYTDNRNTIIELFGQFL